MRCFDTPHIGMQRTTYYYWMMLEMYRQESQLPYYVYACVFMYQGPMNVGLLLQLMLETDNFRR